MKNLSKSEVQELIYSEMETTAIEVIDNIRDGEDTYRVVKDRLEEFIDDYPSIYKDKIMEYAHTLAGGR